MSARPLPTDPLDIWSAIAVARRDPAITAVAKAKFLALAGDLFEDTPRRELHISDAGACVRFVWARIHNQPMLPIEPETQLSRFDEGHFAGAWLASLLAAYFEANFGVTPLLEPHLTHEGIIGSADFVVPGYWAIDFKLTYFTGGPDAKDYHRLQVVKYALAQNCTWASIFVSAPAAYKKDTPKRAQFDYLVAEHADENAAEYARLARALGKTMPEGDPKESWRCRLCEFAACSRNTNPAKDAMEVPFA